MISVIICSPNAQRAETVCQHVAATIGVPHEVLLVPDALEKGGMCAAYNQAAAGAQYEVLCFLHDDVELHTPEWGRRVLDHFAADAALGVIGLAGSRYKSAVLSGWSTGRPDADACNILQSTPGGAPARVWLHPGNAADKRVPVKTLDGVWLCTRKSVWQQVRFSDHIPGFHFYDIDFSLRVAAQYTAAVVYDIDLLHFSQGTFADAWMENAIRFHTEWNQVALPTGLDKVPADAETGVQRFWLNRLLKEPISGRLRRRWLAVNKVLTTPVLWNDGFKFFIYPVYRRFKKA